MRGNLRIPPVFALSQWGWGVHGSGNFNGWFVGLVTRGGLPTQGTAYEVERFVPSFPCPIQPLLVGMEQAHRL